MAQSASAPYGTWAFRGKVAFGVVVGLVVGMLPLMNKTVYEREQRVHRMRDDSYDMKDAARNSRLTRSSK